MPDAKKLPPAARRLTIPYPEAMARLSVCRTTLDGLCNRDVFTCRRPRGKGRGKSVFLFLDEVELYDETRSEDAVRDLRARKKRMAA